MKYNPLIHNRRSIRLKGFDYSKAALYFITMCVQDVELLFGEIENGEMILNDAGRMVQAEWKKLPQRFHNIRLHEFIVMPNHFHGILEIVGLDVEDRATVVGAALVVGLTDAATAVILPEDTANPKKAPVKEENDEPMDRATTRVAPTVVSTVAMSEAPKNKTVGDIIGAFKSITTVEYIHGVKNSNWEPFNGKLWQRDYYDHIIRDERAYLDISAYIINNPARWEEDKFNRKRKPSR